MNKRLFAAILLVLSLCLLSGCGRYTYSQESIGNPPETIDETTILGTWYFEGHEDQYLIFNEDKTYITSNKGNEGKGTWSLSEDFMTLHLKEETSGIDDDVELLYGEDILYLRWRVNHEQIFTREIKKEK